MRADPAAVALNYAAMRAAADVADHWVQTDRQAALKGAYDDAPLKYGRWPGDPEFDKTHRSASGRRHCAAHVASYVAVQGATVTALAAVSGMRLRPGWVVAGLALSAVSHYAADRRRPLRQVADAIPGKSRFVRLADHGINGAYLLDQAWHHGFELVAAAVMAVGAE